MTVYSKALLESLSAIDLKMPQVICGILITL